MLKIKKTFKRSDKKDIEDKVQKFKEIIKKKKKKHSTKKVKKNIKKIN